MNNSDSTVADFIRAGQQAFRRELAAESVESAKRLEAAYAGVLGKLSGALAGLEDEARSKGMTSQGLAFTGASKRLQQQMIEALGDFSALIGDEAAKLQLNGGEVGAAIGGMSLDTLVGSSFNKPSVEEIRALIRYVDSPAFRFSLEQYGSYHAQAAADLILANASLGKSPEVAARAVLVYVDNMPFADAYRMVDTVQLWSARRGQQATFQANKDIVESWIWSSARDAKTCLSCISQDGQEFPLDEILNDHWLGRCAMLPKTTSWQNLGFSDGGNPFDGLQTGQEWFDALSESKQRAMMGGARWMAYKDGAFDFGDLSKIVQSPVYGPMRTEASLVDLVGADAAATYKAKVAGR